MYGVCVLVYAVAYLEIVCPGLWVHIICCPLDLNTYLPFYYDN